MAHVALYDAFVLYQILQAAWHLKVGLDGRRVIERAHRVKCRVYQAYLPITTIAISVSL
jgi:hypothetical protein